MNEFEKQFPEPSLLNFRTLSGYNSADLEWRGQREGALWALKWVKSKTFISNNGSLNGWYIPLETISQEIEELEK